MFADGFLAADFRGDKILHAVIALPGAVFFLRVANLVDEEGAQGVVFLLPEEIAVGGEAIAAGAAGFLIELLNTVGKAEADDGADVGLVDAEAEGDGADKDVNLFAHPAFLIGAAGGGVHLAVIADSGDAVLLEEIDEFTDAGDGGAIDDDVAAAGLADGFEDQGVLLGLLGFADDVAKIFTAEAGDGFEGIAKRELLDNVVPDLLRGAGGEGGDGEIGNERAEFAELAILGAEIVSPLGDAVGFVDGEERDGHVFEPAFGGVHDGAFGGDVDEAEFAGGGFLAKFAAIGFEDGAVEEDGGDAHLVELGDLVLHESDEGRDDDGGAGGVENGGKLVAEGFAAAGGHDDADVAAGIERADDFFLAGAEGRVAPVALEGREVTVERSRREGGGGGHGSSAGVGGPPAGHSFAFSSPCVKGESAMANS